MQDLIDQVKSGADSLELFARGDRYLRMREMGKPEGPEVETELRPCRRKLVFEGKGKRKGEGIWEKDGKYFGSGRAGCRNDPAVDIIPNLT